MKIFSAFEKQKQKLRELNRYCHHYYLRKSLFIAVIIIVVSVTTRCIILVLNEQ